MHTRQTTQDLTAMALMAAVLTLCAWLALPLGPALFTLQTFGIFAALVLLGGRRGTLTILLYLFLGVVGLPVFSGFSAGAGVLLGPTGGYLLGFLALGLVYWGLTARLGQRLAVQVLALLLGLAACYGFGTAWFLLVYTGGGGATLRSALTLCVVPYVLPDLLKLALALLVARRVGRTLSL